MLDIIYERVKPSMKYIPRGIMHEAHIADIHFGAIDPEKQYNILKEQFLEKIFKLKLNLISINGDLFDHKFMSNSDAVMYAINFIDQIVNYCRYTGCTLIIIHGTMSHDANQLKLFYKYLTDKTVDVRIVEEARFEYVNNKKILCIPEMYNKGSEYYTNLLIDSGLYDSCILHGTISGSIYGVSPIQKLDSEREPIFDIDSFGNCMGPIICGHVHVAKCLNNHIYYCGSPIRTCFGEEQPKGFSILIHDLDTQKYHMHFEEIKSFRYDTVYLDDIIKYDAKTIVDKINEIKSNGIDYLRVVFTIPHDNVNIIKDYFRNRSDIVIKDDRKMKIMTNQSKELEEKIEKYSYILDHNLSPEEILTKFINQNMGYTYITTEELINILKDV